MDMVTSLSITFIAIYVLKATIIVIETRLPSLSS